MLDASLLPAAGPGVRYFVEGMPQDRGWRSKAEISAWYDANRPALNWTVAGNFALRGDPATHVIVGRNGRPIRW